MQITTKSCGLYVDKRLPSSKLLPRPSQTARKLKTKHAAPAYIALPTPTIWLPKTARIRRYAAQTVELPTDAEREARIRKSRRSEPADSPASPSPSPCCESAVEPAPAGQFHKHSKPNSVLTTAIDKSSTPPKQKGDKQVTYVSISELLTCHSQPPRYCTYQVGK